MRKNLGDKKHDDERMALKEKKIKLVEVSSSAVAT